MTNWYAYRRTPEQCYILREDSNRYVRRLVWKTLNQIPPSARPQFYQTLPTYIADRVQTRVEQIEKGLRKRKQVKSMR